METLDSLSMHYLFFSSKSDSAFFYINDFIDSAFKRPNPKYLILGYARLGFYYLNTGHHKAALEASLKGIHLSQEFLVNDYLSALYYNLAWVYDNMGDLSSALTSAFTGLQMVEQSRDLFIDQQLHLVGMIGNIYLDKNNYDSARYYFNKVQLLANASKELAAKDISNWYEGMYFLNTAAYAKADSVLSRGIASCEQNGDFLLNVFHLFLAQSFFYERKFGNSIQQASKALAISIAINDLGDAQGAA